MARNRFCIVRVLAGSVAVLVIATSMAYADQTEREQAAPAKLPKHSWESWARP